MTLGTLNRACGWILLLLLLGCTPKPPAISLQEAVQKGNTKAVEQHIAAKTDLNKKDRLGWTALHFAAMKGDLTLVKTLTAAGADVNATGPNGRTPLDMAREKGKVQVAQFLQQQGKSTATTGRGLVDGGLGVSSVLDSQ